VTSEKSRPDFSFHVSLITSHYFDKHARCLRVPLPAVQGGAERSADFRWRILRLRPLRYLVLIALAAFIGDLAHIALDPRSQTPCIGASGGLAGVITFYALNFPRMRLAFLMRWGYIRFRWIRLPAWFVFVLWISFQLVGALEQKAGMSSVSSAAH
jgi:hypothetical protein